MDCYKLTTYFTDGHVGWFKQKPNETLLLINQIRIERNCQPHKT